MTLTPDAEGKASTYISIVVNDAVAATANNPLYSIDSFFNIRNALFVKDGEDCDSFGVEVKCKGSTDVMPNLIEFGFQGDTGIPDEAYNGPSKYLEYYYEYTDVLDDSGKKIGTRSEKKVKYNSNKNKY